MKKQNEMMVFNNEIFGELRTISINEEPYFMGKDVAEALGYTDTNRAVKQHVDKEDLKACSRKGYGDLYPTLWDNENDFANKILINESGLYSLIFGSKLESAKAFKRWVTSEVLPQIRKSGVYITESATDEAIDFNRVYGKRRVRKSIRETRDVRKLFEDYIELSAAERISGRLTNKDRINTLNIFADELENKLANEAVNMRGSELLATQELLTDIHKEKNRLSNKANGGIKSAQTKRINQLELENKELKEQSYDDLDWKKVSNHGFTENCRLEYSQELKRMVRTKAFNAWKNHFDYSDFRPLNCDTSRPMIIYLHFGKLEKFDTTNLEKTAIDIIAEWYDFDDNLIISKVTTSEIVNSYSEGFILFDLINASDDDEI